MVKRGPNGRNTKSVGWHIDQDLLTRFKAACDREGKTTSRVIEEAMEIMLKHLEPPHA